MLSAKCSGYVVVPRYVGDYWTVVVLTATTTGLEPVTNTELTISYAYYDTNI